MNSLKKDQLSEDEAVDVEAEADVVVGGHRGGSNGGSRSQDDYSEKPQAENDPNTYCIRCSKIGHNEFNLWSKAKESNNYNSSDVDYEPNFTRHVYSSSYQAKATRLIANTSQVQPTNPYDFAVDTGVHNALQRSTAQIYGPHGEVNSSGIQW
jgi:hypothetical protein